MCFRLPMLWGSFLMLLPVSSLRKEKGEENNTQNENYLCFVYKLSRSFKLPNDSEMDVKLVS